MNKLEYTPVVVKKLLGILAIKEINLHNKICRQILIFFFVFPYQSRRLVVMSRRRSQSVQKSQKSQSVRPNALDGLDGLLTTLLAIDSFRKVITEKLRSPTRSNLTFEIPQLHVILNMN